MIDGSRTIAQNENYPNPNPKPNPNTNWWAIFLGDNFPDTMIDYLYRYISNTCHY